MDWKNTVGCKCLLFGCLMPSANPPIHISYKLLKIYQRNQKNPLHFYFFSTILQCTKKDGLKIDFETRAFIILENILYCSVTRKNYGKGIDELKYTPEIAPGVDQVTDDADPPLQSLDTPVDEKKSAPQPVVRKPLKLCDGTPVKRGSATPVTPGADSARIRGTKRSAEESETEGNFFLIRRMFDSQWYHLKLYLCNN